jgi:monothiol glutaredoxin
VSTSERNVQAEIATIVGSSRVVLFMKGTPQFPQCGFSSRAAQILQACGIQEFAYCNVLEDGAIREGVKTYSSWPTIPQLYVDGNFVGGADIMQEMYASGELQSILTT